MLGIGKKFPEYRLNAVVSTDQTKAFSDHRRQRSCGQMARDLFLAHGLHLCVSHRDCAFGKLEKEFRARDAQLLGASTDSEYVHLAWRRDKQELKDLPFPMLADVKARTDGGAWHPG